MLELSQWNINFVRHPWSLVLEYLDLFKGLKLSLLLKVYFLVCCTIFIESNLSVLNITEHAFTPWLPNNFSAFYFLSFKISWNFLKKLICFSFKTWTLILLDGFTRLALSIPRRFWIFFYVYLKIQIFLLAILEQKKSFWFKIIRTHWWKKIKSFKVPILKELFLGTSFKDEPEESC